MKGLFYDKGTSIPGRLCRYIYLLCKNEEDSERLETEVAHGEARALSNLGARSFLRK